MRTAFINQLIEEARLNHKIFLIVGDLGFSVVEPFVKEFPKQFLNAGISEQNMLGIASGLSMEGYNVFVYSIGNFPTLRCMEQIRYDVCYHNLNVKIVAVGGGYSYGSLGPSHHATEDVGMLRILPNLAILAPSDPYETKSITKQLSKFNGPAYLRLGKAGEPLVHSNSININWGDIINVIEGSDTCVLCYGSILSYCQNYIKTHNKNWSLYSIPYLKPTNDSLLINILNKYSRIITIEEHQKNGGLGSLLLEKSNEFINNKLINRIPSINIIGINDKFFSLAGSQQYLRNSMGLYLDNFND